MSEAWHATERCLEEEQEAASQSPPEGTKAISKVPQPRRAGARRLYHSFARFWHEGFLWQATLWTGKHSFAMFHQLLVY